MTNYGYDPQGNRTTIVADAGGGAHFNATSRFTYDAQGRMLTAADPVGTRTQYAYDALGDLVSVIGDFGGLNQTILFSYDGAGNLLTTTDPNGNTTTTAWDADRRLVQVTAPPAPLPLITADSYDPDGRLIGTTQSANGAVLATRSATYTPTGRLATVIDANGNVTKYTYDMDERLAQVTDALGNLTVYGYDALSRPDAVSSPAIQSNPLTQRSYTPDGLLASLTIARSNSLADTTSFTYDGFDRLSTTTYPDNSAESLTYDADGNVRTRKTRKGDTIAFAYDSLNRVCTKTYATSPVACGGGSANYLVSYGYDLDGRLTNIADNSGTVTAPSTSASYTASTSYDAMNRPLQVSWSPAASQTAPTASSASFGFGYDPANRRISQTATDNSWWDYPPNPTTTTIAYTANNLNQYSAVGSVSPTYDADGNLTYDGTFTYGYDAEGRLTSVKQGGTTEASYAYDAQGRRKAKTVGSTTTMFVTDAANREVLEYDGTSGAVERWYAFGQGPDAVLGQMNVAAGTRETMIPDVQGSIIGMLASGGALSKTGYQPFGENPALTSGTFQYAARRFDPETAGSTAQPSGLYYFRARMYSPTWGRFLQSDPIGYAGGSNLYAYTNNDPLNNTDPFGTCDNPQGCGGSAGILMAGGTAVPALGAGNILLGGSAAATAIGTAGIGVTAGSYQSAIIPVAGGTPSPNEFVPYNRLPPGAQPILQERTLLPNGAVAVTIPPGYISEPAANGQGLVFRAPGTTGNENTIRLSLPNARNPTMYLRYYNASGQPISPFTGRTGTEEETHFPFGGAIINPSSP